MKNNFKLLFFIITSFLLLLSCEKEEHHHHHSEESKITRNVKITNLPGLQNAIQNKEQNNILGRNEINYFDLINYDNITEIEQNDGSKTYTFSLNLIETNQLTNLIVIEKDEVYQYDLITYTSTQIEEWKEKVQNHQQTDIQLVIEVVTIDDETLGSRTTDCYTAGWICPSGQHQDGDQGLCVYDYSQWSYAVYAVPCNSEGGGGGNPGNPNPTPEIPENEPPFTEPNWPTLSPAIASFIMGLSPSQTAWWNSTSPVIRNQIISYLMLNVRNDIINSQALVFALELIQSVIESGLNLDFNKSLKSPANIDFSAIDQNTLEGQQFTWIYSKLMESDNFKQMFTETFQVNDPRINVKFEITNDGIPSDVNGICKLETLNGEFYNIIKIKKSIFGIHSNMSIAKTVLHECIHAYLNIKKIDSNLGTTIAELNGLDLGQLLGTFTVGFGGVPVANGTLTQHDFMFNYMIPVFTNVLADLKDDLILPSDIVESEQTIWYLSNNQEYNFNWPDLYFYLSLNGLHGSTSFLNEFPTISLNFEKYYFMQDLGVFSLTKTTF